MDTKKILQQLIKIAEKQQEIIKKLAQPAPSTPESQTTTFTPGQTQGKAAPPPATPLNSNAPKSGAEDQVIRNSLPATLQAAVADIKVVPGQVNVTFKPGQRTQANYNAVKAIVEHLQHAGLLAGTSYKVHAV